MSNSNTTNGLAPRQQAAIPHLLTGRSNVEGCKKARISRKTFYEWLKDPVFRKELKAQRETLIAEALENLKGNMTNAVETLVTLLDTATSDNLKRLLAKDILEYSMKAREQEELLQRIEWLENHVRNR